MDEFDIDNSIDSSFSADSSIDSFESSGDSFDVMDTVETPTFEETSFDDVESSSIEDFSFDDTEILNNEVDDIMGNVEVEELTFDDEIMEDVSPIETLETISEQPIEDLSSSSIEAMEDVESEVLEFDDQESYEATPNSEIEILQEDGTVDTLENIQEQLEAETEPVEQVEEPYEAAPNSEIEILQEDGTVDTLENIQEQLESDAEPIEQVEAPYEAIPNSEIEILQEDGTVDTLENIQEQLEAETEPVEQVEAPYEAIPNSEIEILQEDGTVDTLENIQEQLEAEPEAVEQVEAPYEATPNSEIEILQEDGTVDTLENIQEQLESEPEALEQVETNIETQIENATSIEELTQIRNQILQEGLPEQEVSETNIESQIDNTESIEELALIRNQILQEGLPENEAQEYEDYSEEYIEDKPKTLVREITPEIIESRNADTEVVLDNYRENLREYGVDEDAIEQFVAQERDKINAEFESLDRGDLESNRYYEPTDWEGVAAGLKGEQIETSNIAEIAESTDTIIEPIDPSEIDYDEVFEGLDSYDFDGVDYLQDVERLDSSLISFQPERWQELDLNQQKEAMTELAEYVQEVTGLENPPTIEFYNNPVDGDYGGYMASTNTLSINEHMLYDSNEAADTVAHELWHAYQHERAMNPQSAKDYQYQYNFDHYISPKRDMFGRFVNFTEYQDQLVEAEARAFAEQFKGRLGGYSGSN